MDMTTTPDPVRSEIMRLARGRRLTRFVTVTSRTLFVALFGAVGVAWWTRELAPTAVVAGAAVALALVVGIAVDLLARIDRIAVAKRYDDRIGSKDLVASAIQLDDAADGFSGVVREDALQATGKATARELYPLAMPLALAWIPLPLAAGAFSFMLPWFMAAPGSAAADQVVQEALHSAADRVDDLVKKLLDQNKELDSNRLEQIKNLAKRLRDNSIDKRRAMAEIAKLAAQLDKERKQLESRRFQVEKNTAKLARGEDAQDARRDMESGKYREAANKVKKKIAALEKKLKEAIEKKVAKIEIEKLRKRIAKLKTLLAELEELAALGTDLGMLVETLEILERIEGELGELGEYDGDEFDEVELGKMRPRARPRDVGEKPKKLLIMPSNEAGSGHSKKTLGKARRSLTEREELETRLRESKGKSSFGQVKTANDGSRSRRAYNDAFLAAKRAAEDRIYRQNIPAGYRTYIRRYFESMQPDRPDRGPPTDDQPAGNQPRRKSGR